MSPPPPTVLLLPFTHSQNLLAGTPQQDGTGFGVLALSDEGEVLIADLLHLEQPRTRPDILLFKLVCPTGDPRPTRPGEGHHPALGMAKRGKGQPGLGP